MNRLKTFGRPFQPTEGQNIAESKLPELPFLVLRKDGTKEI
jgi:hypothetical protein